MMEPQMKKLLDKIQKDAKYNYFELEQGDKDILCHEIAASSLNVTISMINGYTREELPDVFDITITNLLSLQQQFEDMEMYQLAQMMKDAIEKLTNDLQELVGQKL